MKKNSILIVGESREIKNKVIEKIIKDYTHKVYECDLETQEDLNGFLLEAQKDFFNQNMKLVVIIKNLDFRRLEKNEYTKVQSLLNSNQSLTILDIKNGVTSHDINDFKTKAREKIFTQSNEEDLGKYWGLDYEPSTLKDNQYIIKNFKDDTEELIDF